MVRFKSPGKVAREQRQREAREASRRQFMRAGLYGLIGIAGSFALVPTAVKHARQWHTSRQIASLRAEPITLAQARAHPELRQHYLDQLIGTNQIPYCTGVVYDHDGSKIIGFYEQAHASRGGIAEVIGPAIASFRGGMYDLKTPDILNDAGKEGSLSIFVGREVFEGSAFAYFTEPDLAHCIRYHEGRHCVQHAQGLPFIAPAQLLEGLNQRTIHPLTAYHLAEYDALAHELKAGLTHEQLGERYVHETRAKYVKTGHDLSLRTAQTSSALERELIPRALEVTYRTTGLRDISVPSSHYEAMKRFK